MPKIICNEPGNLTGQIGSVPFVKGVGETESESMLSYFLENPDRFEVLEDETVPSADPDQAAKDEAARLEAEKAEADRIEAERLAAQEAEATRLAAAQAPNPAPPVEPAAEPDPYEAMNVEQLRKACRAATLPQAGSKDELQKRLREHAAASKSED